MSNSFPEIFLKVASMGLQITSCICLIKARNKGQILPYYNYFLIAFILMACRRITAILENRFEFLGIFDSGLIPLTISICLFLGIYKACSQVSPVERALMKQREQAISQNESEN